MQTPSFPTKKVDAETAPRSIKDTDLLQPLQFLIAARRGVQMDPSFSEINIPEDRHITYNGDSGFISQRSRALFWTRCIIWLGYMNNTGKFGLVALVFLEAMNISSGWLHLDDPMKTRLLKDCLWSSYWTMGFILLLYLARVYAKRYMAEKVPPHLDPLSYQCQFKSALDERGWQYREIVGRSLKDMERIWSKDQSQIERFRIDGLMDSGSAYDVVVILHTEGKVHMSFRAPEEASWWMMIVPVLNPVFYLATIYFCPAYPFVLMVERSLSNQGFHVMGL